MLGYWSCGAANSVGGPRRIPFFTAKFDDSEALTELSSLVLCQEEAIKSCFPAARVGGAEAIQDSLTSRYYAYNLLTWPAPCVRSLAGFIHSSYLDMLGQMPNLDRQETFIQCWANTVRKGQCIHIHNHGDAKSYFSGNLAVRVAQHERSFTHYSPMREMDPDRRLSLNNEPGLVTFFPSWLFHFTDPWPHDEVRITIAFDIVLRPVFERQAQYRLGRKYIPFDCRS